MITKSTGYRSSDNTFHSSLEEAQAYEISRLLTQAASNSGLVVDAEESEDTKREILETSRNLVKSKDALVDILTMKPNSLPKARKINGGTKKRTPKHIAEQNVLPLEAK